MGIDVAVLRVFTDAAGDFGNRLGVVDSAQVPPPCRQGLASELGYSETIFVHLAADGSTTADARIFTPVTELPFAGHPTVGAAWWLRQRGTPIRTLQVPAGIVEVPAISGAFMVMARDRYLALGGMDEAMFLHIEDVDLCLRCVPPPSRSPLAPGRLLPP